MTKLIERARRKESLANSDELTELMEVAVNFAKSGNKIVEEAAGETAKSWTNAVYAVEFGRVFLVCVFENNGVLDGIIISELFPIVAHGKDVTQNVMTDHEQINMTFNRDEDKWSTGIYDNENEEPRTDGVPKHTALKLIEFLRGRTVNPDSASSL